MESGTRDVSRSKRDGNASDWTDEEPADSSERVAVLPENEADARAVTCSERPQLTGSRPALWMHDHE